MGVECGDLWSFHNTHAIFFYHRIEPGRTILFRRWHFRVGRALRPLRDEGVMILGSGSATHNLSEYFHPHEDGTPKWASAFEKWLADAGNFIDKLPPDKLWEGGQKLYNQRGCKQCHSIDGAAGIGPSFKGIWGHTQALAGGGQATVEENYVRESILNPQAKIVAGFEPVMPTYQGRLKDKEITAIIAYLKTLE